MSQSTLADLPLEIQCTILHNLPVATLLTFARTSHHNYTLVRTVLTTLNLAVFSKKVHGVLAYLNAANSINYGSPSFLSQPELDWMNIPVKVPDHDIPPLNGRRARCHRQRGTTNRSPPPPPSVPPTLPTPQAYRNRQIHHQNAHLSTILSSSCLSRLTTLTIHTYALLAPSLASTLSTQLPHLRHLTLNFSHPAIHDSCLPSFYWETCPSIEKEGSTAWNLLGGIGSVDQGRQGLHTLQSLSVTRAALTSLQLRKWVERNPGLRALRLELVSGVDRGFVEGLAKLYLCQSRDQPSSQRRVALRTLALTSCTNLTLTQREDFAWLEVLLRVGGLREVSFKGCQGVNLEVLREVAEERGWMRGGGGGEGEGGLRIVEFEDAEMDGEALETRSLTHESTGGVGKEKGRLGPFIEIDPQFD